MTSVQDRPPLQLTVFPRRGRETYVISGQLCLGEVAVDRRSQKKRLTDTELAAEVLSAIFHEAECEVRGLRLIIRHEDRPDIDHYAKHNHEFGRQATILERFATQPHYDEATL